MRLSIDQLKQSESRYAAITGKKAREITEVAAKELFLTKEEEVLTKGNILGDKTNLEKRKEMLSVLRQEPVEFAFERAIGKNDSVYSNFVELIRDMKQKVGRVAIKEGNKNIGFATGFMVSESLMLTNWHVFKTIGEVADSELQFHYELDAQGNPGTPTSFRLRSDLFFYSNKDLDYCLVGVNPIDITGKIELKSIGYIFLDPVLGKLGNEEEEALNIIHHPEGDYMQLSIRENIFVRITPTTIWYRTDTAPGSSGSPVFNDQWQVVALHHMGVAKQNANGDYIDKNGTVIPMVNGELDSSRIVWEANEGIRISVILKDVLSKFADNPLINGLTRTPVMIKGSDGQIGASVPDRTLLRQGQNTIHISLPAALVDTRGAVNFNITKDRSDIILSDSRGNQVMSAQDELDLLEIKKLETSIDFSVCKGYQSGFLGSKHSVALPKPLKAINKFIAKVSGTDGAVLNYHKYSILFHAVRMMPLLSAINVDGDPDKRKDSSKRKDTWLRDRRLDFDIQLDDSYYRNSGFDRGHMSRREDANWGDTAAEAKRNADLTCMYTNACPQVAKINQSSRKGLWGILEQVILEQGAQAESGKTGRISVFNGPIFLDDDPVYKGIQIPMHFFKIVLWLTDSGELKATAFKLSQTAFIGNIDFEQLDLDQNTEFKEFQCSIKSLQKETKINFSRLVKFDTFDGKPGQEVAINTQEELLTHIGKHNRRR